MFSASGSWYSFTEENVKIRFKEILKVNDFFKTISWIDGIDGSISIENISFLRIVILKQQNASRMFLFG